MGLPIIGLGAGGHAKVLIDLILLTQEYEPIGLLDRDERLFNTEINGVPVLGPDSLLPSIRESGVYHFFVGLGGTTDLIPRRKLFELAIGYEFQPVTLIHPSASVSPFSTLGSGTTLMVNSVVNANTQIGKNCIINSGAIIEHDCTIGDHVHVATGATLCGGVTVGDETHIGAGAVVRQLIEIGRAATIGAGTVVIRNVIVGQVVVGNPARPIRGR